MTWRLCNASREFFSSMASGLHPGSQPLTQAGEGGSELVMPRQTLSHCSEWSGAWWGGGGNMPYARRTSKKAAWPFWAAVRKRSGY